jgi:hypothetical protein
MSGAVKLKIGLYKTMVKLFIVYGSEALPVIEVDVGRLNKWERKC